MATLQVMFRKDINMCIVLNNAIKDLQIMENRAYDMKNRKFD